MSCAQLESGGIYLGDLPSVQPLVAAMRSGNHADAHVAKLFDKWFRLETMSLGAIERNDWHDPSHVKANRAAARLARATARGVAGTYLKAVAADFMGNLSRPDALDDESSQTEAMLGSALADLRRLAFSTVPA